MGQPTFMLSTCGTSLLSNQRSVDERKLVSRYANAVRQGDIPDEDSSALVAIISQVSENLRYASLNDVSVLSAELNSLIKFYGSTTPKANDYHLLLCTDTWLGEQAANLAATWLRQYGCSVEVKRQVDLQTALLESFQLAISDLVVWCNDYIPAYRDKDYHIVFNLTGGFKSVQGFLQTMAMFYADETIYVFESGSDLMRIPRLPIRIAATETVAAHLQVFRRLALGLNVDGLDGIPETMIMSDGQSSTLSAWGLLIWGQTNRELYQRQIYPSPSALLRFSDTFNRSTNNLSPDRRFLINRRIDDLARYIETKQGNLQSLDFKQLRGNLRPPSTHECDAWADQDAKRLFGHFEGEVFVLDKLDTALH